MTARKQSAGRSQPRLYRRPDIGGLEFSHLPLPRQQPERVEQTRANGAAHIGVAAKGLEPCPACDRFGARIRRLDRRMDDEERLRLHLTTTKIIGLNGEAVQPSG